MLYCIEFKKTAVFLTVMSSGHTELKQIEEVTHNKILFSAVPHAVQAI